MSDKNSLAERLIIFGAFVVFAGFVIVLSLSLMPKNLADEASSNLQYKTVSKQAYVHSSNESTSNAQEVIVNINTDSAEKLMTLPGIGEKKAQAIIDYREQNGPFNSVDDLINVSGIGEATLNKIRPYVTVE